HVAAHCRGTYAECETARVGTEGDSPMRLSHFGHSCVLVEISGTRLLFDPGTFSTGFEDVRELDAILITHQHPDHIDTAKLPSLVAANPGARLVVDPGTAPTVAELGCDHLVA